MYVDSIHMMIVELHSLKLALDVTWLIDIQIEALFTCCKVNIENVTFLTCGRIQCCCYNLICMTTINNVKLYGAKLNHIKWFFNENWWRSSRESSHSRELTHHNLPRTICDEISWKEYLLCHNINCISGLPSYLK